MAKKQKKDDKDLITLERALLRAEHRGYSIPPLEYLLFVNDRPPNLTSSLKIWARGLIFTPEFASAFFGTEEVDDYGYNVKAITMWARQVFVKHANKLHAAIPDRPDLTVIEMDEVDFTEDTTEPEELVNAREITYKLENLAASFPFETHKIDEFEVKGGEPAYMWHLKNMAVAPNPFEYLQDYINKETEANERKDNPEAGKSRNKSSKAKKENNGVS